MPRYGVPSRVLRRAPERFSALRPPLDSGSVKQVKNPGRRNAPRERDGLFDMVKCEYAAPAFVIAGLDKRSLQPGADGSRLKIMREQGCDDGKDARRTKRKAGLRPLPVLVLFRPVISGKPSRPDRREGGIEVKGRTREPREVTPAQKSPRRFAPPGVVSSTRHASIKERCRGGRGCEGRSFPDPGARRRRSAWRCWQALYRSPPRSMPSPASGRSHRSPRRTTV